MCSTPSDGARTGSARTRPLGGSPARCVRPATNRPPVDSLRRRCPGVRLYQAQGQIPAELVTEDTARRRHGIQQRILDDLPITPGAWVEFRGCGGWVRSRCGYPPGCESGSPCRCSDRAVLLLARPRWTLCPPANPWRADGAAGLGPWRGQRLLGPLAALPPRWTGTPGARSGWALCCCGPGFTYFGPACPTS